MKYAELKEELEQEGYSNSRPPRGPMALIDCPEIDKETIENDPICNTCQECGGQMRYQPWHKTGSYRAIAVCSSCDEAFDF